MTHNPAQSRRRPVRGRRRQARPGYKIERRVENGYEKTRQRYTGRGVPGAPSVAATDLVDVRVALHELQLAAAELVRLDGDVGATRGESIERHLAIRGKVALAGRACDAVTLRPHPTWPHRRPL